MIKQVVGAAIVGASFLTSGVLFASQTQPLTELSHSIDLTNASQHSEAAVTRVGERDYIQQGDMLIPVRPFQIMSQFDPAANLWTDGIVYYAFDLTITAENRQNFIEAAAVWSEIADLTFVERSDQANYIHIRNSDGNTAAVGMVGGSQAFNINAWHSKYVIVHELGHTLGMWHEQQRSDRDDYVDILLENIEDGLAFAFNKRTSTTYSAYDFLSVMHYSSHAFTKNGQPTIVAKPEYSEYSSLMGQKRALSGGDQFSVATHYGAVTINIADPAFKAYLVANFDLNNDGEIDSLEAASVTQIKTPGNGEINSLQGIKFFRQLNRLDASDENLSELTGLPFGLRDLKLSGNQLSYLGADLIIPPLLNSLVVTRNPLNEYSCESIEFIQTALASKTFLYNPIADSTSLVCTAESKFILASGKPKFDRRNKGPQTFNISVPANASQLSIETSDTNGVMGGEMNIYVAFNRQPSPSDYDYASTNPNNIEQVIVNQPQAGTWYILLEPSNGSFENVDLVATYSLTNTQQEDVLANGVVANNQQAVKGESVDFTLTVPSGATDLAFVMSGGNGDADLYVRFGQQPSLSSYDCRPWLSGNNETCTISNIQPGIYYVSLQAYETFDGVSIVANYSEATTPTNGGDFAATNLSANAGQWLDYTIEVPADMASLTVVINGGTGDADLYVRHNDQPTSSLYDCRPYKSGNQEVCQIDNPAAGTWYLSIKAYESFSQLNLNAQWNP